MSRFFYFFLLQVVFFLNLSSCADSSTPKGFLPEDTHTLLTIHRTDEFLNAIEGSDFWKAYASKLPDAKTQALLSTMGSGKVRLLYTSSELYCIQSKSQANLNLWNPQRESRQVKVGNYLWNYSFYGEDLIISTSANLYNEINLFRTSNNKFHLDISSKETSRRAVATLSLNRSKSLSFFEKIFSENFYYFFQGWSTWDITLDDQRLQMVGISKHYKDTLSLFSLVNAKINHHDTFDNIPNSIGLVKSYSFSGIKKWAEANQTSALLSGQVREVSFFEFKGESFAVVAPSSTDGFLRHFTVIDEQLLAQGELLTLEVSRDMEIFLNAFDSTLTPSYALVVGSNVVFSENKKALIDLAPNVVKERTFAQNPSYKKLQNKVASKSPYWSIKKLPSPWGMVAMQIIPQDDSFIYTFTIGNNEDTERETLTDHSNEVFVQEGVLSEIQVVNNHRTGEKEVIFQDSKQNLCLTSSQGEILWKKTLNAPIVGKIIQVDILKNKKLQYAFTTEKSLYVVDRNGNNVSGFPIHFKEKLMPLSVFDYEGNKDYRFVVSASSHIRLYNSKGKKVEGFAGEKTSGELLFPPKHFRIKNKDYIVYMQTDGRLKILHRNGNERIKIQEQFSFSQNDVYKKDAYFTFTTTQGKQYFVDSEGKVSAQEKDVDRNHFFKIQGNIELFLSDEKLWVDGKKIILPSGYYTWVKQIRYNNEPFFFTYNQENEKLYWLNKEGKIQRGFAEKSTANADVAVEGKGIVVAFLRDNHTIIIKKIVF